MGGCLTKCFARFDRRRQLLKTRYTVEKDASIEFENLMDEDDIQSEMTNTFAHLQTELTLMRQLLQELSHPGLLCLLRDFGRLVTERERQLVSTKQYNTLIHEQKKQDREIDRKLHEEEEELRREEEAYYEAKREAARIAQLHKQKEDAAKAVSNGPKNWTSGADGEWEVAGGEDDFEMFLETVRTRSLKATAHLRKDGTDGLSTNSSSTPTQQTRERSHTEGSNSIDLEWDHDEDVGMITPISKERSSTEEDLMKLAAGNVPRESPSLSAGSGSGLGSGDLEWDADFMAAEDQDTQMLLTTGNKIGVASAR